MTRRPRRGRPWGAWMDRPSPHSSWFRSSRGRWPSGCLSAILLLMAGFPAQAAVDFQDRVLPVLQASCLPCHDRHTRTSGFSVESLDSVLSGGARHGAAVKPGAPGQSPLIQVLRGEVQPRMPLGRAFSEDHIQLIEQWIDGLSAAPQADSQAEPYWAFAKPSPRSAARGEGLTLDPKRHRSLHFGTPCRRRDSHPRLPASRRSP